MAKKNKLVVYGVIDRSGSMHGERWVNAIQSFNEYINGLKEAKVKGVINLMAFDAISPPWVSPLQAKVSTSPTGVRSFTTANHTPSDTLRLVPMVDSVDISKFVAISPDLLQPAGMTPLYDAAGKVMNTALANHTDEKVVIVVMTDGQENASSEYSQLNIKSKVDEVTKKGWEVIFLGANFDATAYAVSSGLNTNTKLRNFSFSNYDANDKASFKSAFTDLTNSTIAYTTGNVMDVSGDKK